MVQLMLLMSCQDKEPEIQDDTSESVVDIQDSGDSAASNIEMLPRLNDIQLLTRISLDIRGIRPSIEEMDRITVRGG